MFVLTNHSDATFLGDWTVLYAVEIPLPIQIIHSFLVHPEKGLEPHAPHGTRVRHEGQLFEHLQRVFDRAPTECDIDICFRPDERGQQENPCRSLFIEYLTNSTVFTARSIAHRLASFTDRRSGLGLLFLIKGTRGREHQLLVSRFPTDEGISADESSEGLDVRYLERVFMKSKFSYKAVYYQDQSLRHGLWTGRAIDRQNSDQGASFSSNYWVGDFLCSDLSETAAAGTRRLAVAFREALKKVTPPVRQELVAAATLATGLRGQSVSISAIADRFNLSGEARTAVEGELKGPAASRQRFRFDEEEFRAVVGLLSVELDNEGIMTAPSARFDEIFRRHQIRGSEDIEFSTRGRIIDQKLKRSL